MASTSSVRAALSRLAAKLPVMKSSSAPSVYVEESSSTLVSALAFSWKVATTSSPE